MAEATKTFEYVVRDRQGKTIKGSLEAQTQSQVVSKLRERGMAPLSIVEAGGGLQKEINIPGLDDKITLKDLAVMARQLATMIDSGLSLLRALTILAEQTESKPLARVIGQVRNDVEQGVSFSVSLNKHPDVFPPIMINMVKAGEVGGFLDQVLISVATNFEKEVRLRAKIKSAMTYPVVVFIFAIIASLGMLTFIVPIFADMFSSLGGDLPGPTKFLQMLSQQMSWFIPLIAVSTIVFVIWWKKNKNTEAVRSKWDPIKIKMPVFGPLIQKIAVSRFTRNFGTMLAAGVPILQSLDIVGSTSGSWVIEQATKDIQDSVRRGESLTGPLAKHEVFPPMVVQMLSVGEDTGAIDTMLHKIADFYDDEVEATTEQLTSLIEPIMIVLIGGIVGGMIIALYMPIFSIFELIG